MKRRGFFGRLVALCATPFVPVPTPEPVVDTDFEWWSHSVIPGVPNSWGPSPWVAAMPEYHRWQTLTGVNAVRQIEGDK